MTDNETALQTVGVVGAGVMGTGAAQALAQAGFDVVLVDRSDAILAEAQRAIRNGMRLRRLLAGRPPLAGTATLGRIGYHKDLDELAAVDFVIENITEDWKLKRAVYERIDRLCGPDCVFAANTSVIPITRIGRATGRPANVLGMHFMNPVPLKSVVEVIRGTDTSEQTVATALRLLERMGMVGVVVRDSPGFVTNRVLMLTINEAIFLVHEGVASVEQIDNLFRGCFEHRMGPLETADLIGLDTVLLSIEGLHESFRDAKYRPCQLLRDMVRAGRYGRKSGRGFYTYAANAAAE